MEVLPLRTPTLPPATHTNTVFVGREHVWIVDPATPFEDGRAQLLEHVEGLAEDGRTPRGIFLTHHHRDHVGGAAWLQARTGLPIHAHATTAALAGGGLQVDHTHGDGDALSGSDASDDQWQILHTPGHASDHLCLWQPELRALIGGDMVASIGTIIVIPPDGHMKTYIAQLRRLAQLDPSFLVPSHGAVIEEPVAHLDHYIAHRLEREGKVVAALEEGPAELATVTERAYPEVPRHVLPLARFSCQAHLDKLLEEHRASRSSDGIWAAAGDNPA